MTAGRDTLSKLETVTIAAIENGVAQLIEARAVIAAWSNGQPEGPITKLKLVKRQMYGRAKRDLLEARLIGAS